MQEKRPMVNKSAIMKLQSFCTVEETMRSSKWERVFASDSSGRWSLARIYSKLKRQTLRKRTTQEKWTRDVNRKKSLLAFTKCSTALMVREVQVKSTGRLHLSPVRMAIGNPCGNKCGCSRGERGTPVPLMGV